MKTGGIAGNAWADSIAQRHQNIVSGLRTTRSGRAKWLLLSLAAILWCCLLSPPAILAEDDAVDKEKLAGLNVAIWKPAKKGKAPLIIFSHGFHGINTQSSFLTKRLAEAGYFVVAPNHKDVFGGGEVGWHPAVPFGHPKDWSDTTYKDRGEDFQNILKALHDDKVLADAIDFSKVGLVGHSLGGYTVLALAGAYPSWHLPGVKAVLALSPYCEPFITHDQLKDIQVPVMYQGGTRDFGITPSLKRTGGAFAKSPSPAYFVEFDQVNHLGFTDRVASSTYHDLIDYYALAFLNKYVRGQDNGDLKKKLAGVTVFSVK